MVRIVCPICERITSVSKWTSDYSHNCADFNPQEATGKQDVLIVGTWEDFTGSDSVRTNNYRGAENRLQGTRAEIEGEDIEDFTALGRRKSLYRQRDWLNFMTIKGSKATTQKDDR